MELTAGIIAGHLQGEVVGDPNVVITGVARIEQSKPGMACFLANPKYEKFLYATKASVVLVNRDFVPSGEVRATLIKVDNAYEAVAVLLGLFSSEKKKKGWEFPTALPVRHQSAGKSTLGPTVILESAHV